MLEIMCETISDKDKENELNGVMINFLAEKIGIQMKNFSKNWNE